MAELTVYTCDRCGGRFEASPGKVWIQTDRRMDGAGSMEDVGLTVDVCHKCAVTVLGVVASESYKGRPADLLSLFKRAKP